MGADTGRAVQGLHLPRVGTVKRKRLVQGKDFHGWAWKPAGDDWAPGDPDRLFHWAEHYRPRKRNGTPTEKGKWVRVKFVEVKA